MFNRRRAAESGLSAGSHLGPYRIDALLGEGGMGRVYRAVREPDGEVVAVKVMRPELASDEQFGRRFLREARAAAEVSHDHLVSVLDAGHDGDRHYLVMRFVPGRTAEQRIKEEGPLAVADVNQMAAEVGAGLDALHGRGLVHRDVKASNIIFDRAGAALTDFGLAKGEGYSALTKPGQVMGTLDYLAPELIRGAPAGPASDLYALGCVVFECLAGQPPFANKGVFQVGMAHLEEAPGDPCASRSDAPSGYGDAVRTALAKDPAGRPPTARAYWSLLHVASIASAG